MAESKEESESFFTKSDNFLDGLVRIGEKLIVLAIGLFIFGALIVQSIWILLACREERFRSSVILLSDNWKALLLLLIPLFYRGIRSFIDRVEEFAGVKARGSGKTSEVKESEAVKPLDRKELEGE